MNANLPCFGSSWSQKPCTPRLGAPSVLKKPTSLGLAGSEMSKRRIPDVHVLTSSERTPSWLTTSRLPMTSIYWLCTANKSANRQAIMVSDKIFFEVTWQALLVVQSPAPAVLGH